MENLLIMQENEFSGNISMNPSTMQPLCTYVDKLVASNFQICFPAPYLSLHAKYSHMSRPVSPNIDSKKAVHYSSKNKQKKSKINSHNTHNYLNSSAESQLVKKKLLSGSTINQYSVYNFLYYLRVWLVSCYAIFH